MEHRGTAVLETPRLTLRPWRESDAGAAFAGWMNDPEVTRYLTWTPHADISVTRSLLRLWEAESADPSTYHWAIVLRGTGELAGDISVARADAYQETGVIGYCLAKRLWGRGIMTEALGEVLRYCFEDVGFRRIAGSHAAENTGSARVMEKNSLRPEGLRRQAFRLLSTGQWVDIVDRGILREEYKRVE